MIDVKPIGRKIALAVDEQDEAVGIGGGNDIGRCDADDTDAALDREGARRPDQGRGRGFEKHDLDAMATRVGIRKGRVAHIFDEIDAVQRMGRCSEDSVALLVVAPQGFLARDHDAIARSKTALCRSDVARTE